MANTYDTFATEFKGYKKQQVEEFVAQAAAEKQNFLDIIQKKNEEIEALKSELQELKSAHADAEDQIMALDEDLTQAEEDVNALKAENELANGALQDAKKRCEELSLRCDKMQADQERVARILVDTEKRAEQILADATEEGVREKERLTRECDDIKQEIYDKLCNLKSIQSMTKKMVFDTVASVKEQADGFEAKALSDIAAQEKTLDEFIAEKERASGLDSEEETEDDELSEVKF